MGCTACGSGGGCATGGCGNKTACSSGRCNRLNTYDWLSDITLSGINNTDYQTIEVSFKNGARKEFFVLPNYIRAEKSDHVVVESPAGGYDIGLVSLKGELVQLQMKKKGIQISAPLQQVLRVANERDMERLIESREAEKETMVQSRVIARELGLQMKIGDVEYQADKRKVTFYYTADGRIDFRELIRIYAREFKVKIEMRQIGARQESARIGGIGACGRELCCSTWLTDFKSVSTVAARYQNLAINQSKLSGQCGRLKCCLNYELSTYLDALKDFPSNIHHLDSVKGHAKLIKTDIFKRLMFFAYHGSPEIVPLHVNQVREIAAMNARGEKPEELELMAAVQKTTTDANTKTNDMEFVDGTGMIELEELRKGDRNKKRPKRNERERNERNDGKKPIRERVQKDETETTAEITDTTANKEQMENSQEQQPKEENANAPLKQKHPKQRRERGERTEQRGERPPKEQRENREPREQRNNNNKENREPKENKEQKEQPPVVEQPLLNNIEMTENNDETTPPNERKQHRNHLRRRPNNHNNQNNPNQNRPNNKPPKNDKPPRK